ncbi:hypothetical protein RRG08_039479 [Elysia crispata]|uniref:Uncharacterized protein n=1 Tax=Elysia crispata TaxID=231223 RepID=A0AAE0YK76_9GAST|nr:hypothetical protein RRG08_039479 [Elysia crispata]
MVICRVRACRLRQAQGEQSTEYNSDRVRPQLSTAADGGSAELSLPTGASPGSSESRSGTRGQNLRLFTQPLHPGPLLEGGGCCSCRNCCSDCQQSASTTLVDQVGPLPLASLEHQSIPLALKTSPVDEMESLPTGETQARPRSSLPHHANPPTFQPHNQVKQSAAIDSRLTYLVAVNLKETANPVCGVPPSLSKQRQDYDTTKSHAARLVQGIEHSPWGDDLVQKSIPRVGKVVLHWLFRSDYPSPCKEGSQGGSEAFLVFFMELNTLSSL